MWSRSTSTRNRGRDTERTRSCLGRPKYRWPRVSFSASATSSFPSRRFSRRGRSPVAEAEPSVAGHEHHRAKLGRDLIGQGVELLRPKENLLFERLVARSHHAITGIAGDELVPRRQIGRARVGKECRSRWSPYH